MQINLVRFVHASALFKSTYKGLKMRFLFSLMLAFLSVSCVTSPSIGFDDYVKKFSKSSQTIVISKNYQKLFADVLPVIEKCYEGSQMLNETKIHSSIENSKNIADISAVMSNFMMGGNRFFWARLLKSGPSETKIVMAGPRYSVDSLKLYFNGRKKCRL